MLPRPLWRCIEEMFRGGWKHARRYIPLQRCLRDVFQGLVMYSSTEKGRQSYPNSTCIGPPLVLENRTIAEVYGLLGAAKV